MTTLLLLIVLMGGQPKYLVTQHDSMDECKAQMYEALEEFRTHKPEIKVVRAECIAVGQNA